MQLLKPLTAILLLTLSATGQAALLSRAGGTMIYDSDRNITWVADANLFQTQAAANPNLVNEIIANVGTINDTPNTGNTPANSGHYNLAAGDFNADTGQLSWYGAMAWAQNLDYGGYSDWRLPTASAKKVQSEMGHLFFGELGGELGQPLDAVHNANYDLFSNVQVGGSGYWSSGEMPKNPAWAETFSLYEGIDSYQPKGDEYFYSQTIFNAWAVRDGDVADASPVPLPGAVWLFGGALLGVGGLRRFERG
ncbi:DUF1566 domain-containing protein [Methylomonas sp. EFPC3]|uniref:DUF1566 domain-containing protein n=1 Tax=Methylomonas sp. EFPC3 TaxID=3021710 RepID=UPI0024169804|nr:DUF1566 domain-containing protein [Methylomonas sp. EFPC3]WFP48570.1 DUF1566 domain-containing protein [Methylomonas sp. EFPC3]